jgi:hypothetical protein
MGRPRRRAWRGIALLVVVLALSALGYAIYRYHGPTPPVEVYRGIVYSCERLPAGPESGGLVHLVCADLNVPGVSLWITPLDPDAVARGWQYRLKYVSSVVREQGLAAAVNGTLFESDSSFIRVPGDWARAVETTVADRVVSHVHQHTYLMWWDDDLIAHIETTKPPSAEVLAKARWAIGGQQPLLVDGKMNPLTGREPDVRTMIAADPSTRRVWIAVFV